MEKMKLEASIINILQVALLLSAGFVSAKNIDPDKDGSQYAYGENVGWINFVPNKGPGVTVSNNKLTGFVWAENIGWINLSPSTYGGVINDGTGQLSGYAWGENVGWINFNPQVHGDANHYGVTIDSEGNFDGWAWGENIGWIHFRFIDRIDWDDLANFTAQWLETGNGLEADLHRDGKVNLVDFGVLASNWLDECPFDWQLGPTGYKVKTSWTAGS